MEKIQENLIQIQIRKILKGVNAITLEDVHKVYTYGELIKEMNVRDASMKGGLKINFEFN